MPLGALVLTPSQVKSDWVQYLWSLQLHLPSGKYKNGIRTRDLRCKTATLRKAVGKKNPRFFASTIAKLSVERFLRYRTAGIFPKKRLVGNWQNEKWSVGNATATQTSVRLMVYANSPSVISQVRTCCWKGLGQLFFKFWLINFESSEERLFPKVLCDFYCFSTKYLNSYRTKYR